VEMGGVMVSTTVKFVGEVVEVGWCALDEGEDEQGWI